MTTSPTEFAMEHAVRLRGLAMTRIEMFAYVLKQREFLDLNDSELRNANAYIWVFSILGLSGVLSIVIAATVPGEWVVLAGYQYFLLFLLAPVRRFKRVPWARPAKMAASEPSE